MRYGVCVSSRAQIDAIASAGFDFCELPAAAVQPFDDEATALPAMRLLGDAPLRAEAFNVLVPPVLPLTGPKVDRVALRSYLRRAFSRMSKLGAQVAVLGSGGARRIPNGYPRAHGMGHLAESMAVVLDEAHNAGITLVLEHLNSKETNTVNSLADAQTLIEINTMLAHRGMKLLVDLYHLEMEQEPLTHVTDAGALLAHVHVAGGERRAPDVPGYDYSGFMTALRKAKYDLRISAECGWDDLAAQAPGALEFMRRGWEESAIVEVAEQRSAGEGEKGSTGEAETGSGAEGEQGSGGAREQVEI
jgi:D-psicose/D-tagatose/L-ribulose 3-epimerase